MLLHSSRTKFMRKILTSSCYMYSYCFPVTEKEALEAVAASLTVDEFLRKWKLQKCEEVFR